MALSDIKIRTAKPEAKAYRLYDRDGMYLEVMPTGKKHWRYKYRLAGKERRLAMGPYPEITLETARKRLLEARRLVMDGIDPVAAKQDGLREAQAEVDRQTIHTFEAVARQWHTQSMKGLTERYQDYVIRRLQTDVFPSIGAKPLQDISPKEVITVLRAVEARGAHELARRLKQTIDQIFRFAVVEEITTVNPVAGFQSKDVLARYQKSHYAALEAKDLPEFIQAIERNDARLYPHTRMAVQLLLLTFVRTSELIESEWPEIDLEAAEWRIPAHRMKMRQEHIVPLSRQAVAMLRELNAMRVHKSHCEWPDYVFPNQVNPRKAMSNNTVLKAIERLGYKGRTTGHGFRALAMSTIKEKLGYRHEVVDRQLAHAPRNKVDAAYDRAQFLDERRVMMQRWADYLDACAVSGGKVVAFGRRG